MKLRNIVAGIGTKITTATVAISVAMSRVRVRALDTDLKDFFATPTPDASGDTPNDMFGGVTKLVKQGGASARSLVTAIGVVFLIISISLAALGLTKKNVTDREQSKQRLVYLIIGAIIFFGSLALLVFAQNISNTVSDAVVSSMPTPTP